MVNQHAVEDGLRINEIDGVAFARQEMNARRAQAGYPPVAERDPWLQVQWNTFAEPTSLAAGLPLLCEQVRDAFAAAGEPMPATSLTVFDRDVRFSEKALAKVVEHWSARREHLVTIDFNTADMDRQAEIHVTVGQGESNATVFEVIVWTAPDVAAVAEALMPVASAQALTTDAVYGAITHDLGKSPRLPFEMWYGIFGGEHRADRFTRGYYWANLLSHEHLQALGGLGEAAKRTLEAGMLFSVVRDEPGRELVWIRMSGRVDQVTDEQLAAMKALLTPTWAPVRYRYYAGYPLRVLKDPGDAYILPPVGTKLPNWDADGNPLPEEPQDEEYEAWIRARKRGLHERGPRDDEFEARLMAHARALGWPPHGPGKGHDE